MYNFFQISDFLWSSHCVRYCKVICKISSRCEISIWLESLRKPIVFYWFKNVLLELSSLQLCLFFFHKMMKFYKGICSAEIGRTSAKLFFSQIEVICVVKIQQKYLLSIEMYFYGFFQTAEVLLGCAKNGELFSQKRPW